LLRSSAAVHPPQQLPCGSVWLPVYIATVVAKEEEEGVLGRAKGTGILILAMVLFWF